MITENGIEGEVLTVYVLDDIEVCFKVSYLGGIAMVYTKPEFIELVNEHGYRFNNAKISKSGVVRVDKSVKRMPCISPSIYQLEECKKDGANELEIVQVITNNGKQSAFLIKLPNEIFITFTRRDLLDLLDKEDFVLSNAKVSKLGSITVDKNVTRVPFEDSIWNDALLRCEDELDNDKGGSPWVRL